MYKIKKKSFISEKIFLMEIEAPMTARNCQPGQFVIVKTDEKGERIPLTICDYDREQGTVTIVVQIVGASSLKLSLLEEGAYLDTFAGPLGRYSELLDMPAEKLKKKKILFVAGGVGAAPVYPQVKWLHEQGVEADCIIGARNRSLVILEEEMRRVGTVYIATDEGDYGFHGNVTQCIRKLIDEDHRSYDLVIAIGPLIMMKFVCLLTREYQIPTVVSMNPIMVDGTGMCGACRLVVDGKVKFACVDGPEFDGHLVDFDQVMKRQTMYRTLEGRAMLKAQEGITHHGGCGNCGEE